MNTEEKSIYTGSRIEAIIPSKFPKSYFFKKEKIQMYDSEKLINQIKINSVEDIIPFINSEFSDMFCYRGQQCSEWKLKSTIERLFEIRKRAISKRSIEEKILRIYRSDFSVFSTALGYDPNMQSVEDAFADIQHYGGPTRLLDWTESFNIALFFATFNNFIFDNAAVFCLNKLHFNASTFDIAFLLKDQPMAPGVKEKLPPERDREKLLHWHSPKRRNNRIINQKGLFIYPGSVEYSFEEALSYSFNSIPIKYYDLSVDETNEAIKRSGLIKLIIPKRIIPDIQKYLKNSGISMRNLFPDFYGAIQSLYEIDTNTF